MNARLIMDTPINSISRQCEILIADDHPIFRMGIINWLNRIDGFHVCGEAESKSTVRQAIQELKPDLLLLDLRLGGEDGIELIKWLKNEFPSLLILVLSQCDEMIFGSRALRAGASGFIMKERSPKELMMAIRTVLHSKIYTSPALSEMLLKAMYQKTSIDDISGQLSDRELQVFELLGVGLGTRAIAERLRLGVKTVETHRENIKKKLGLKDSSSLMHAAINWIQKQTYSPLQTLV